MILLKLWFERVSNLYPGFPNHKFTLRPIKHIKKSYMHQQLKQDLFPKCCRIWAIRVT